MADDGDSLEAEVVEQPGNLLRPIGRRESARGRLAVRGEVHAEDLALPDELGQQWLPYAA